MQRWRKHEIEWCNIDADVLTFYVARWFYRLWLLNSLIIFDDLSKLELKSFLPNFFHYTIVKSSFSTVFKLCHCKWSILCNRGFSLFHAFVAFNECRAIIYISNVSLLAIESYEKSTISESGELLKLIELKLFLICVYCCEQLMIFRFFQSLSVKSELYNGTMYIFDLSLLLNYQHSPKDIFLFQINHVETEKQTLRVSLKVWLIVPSHRRRVGII